VKVIRPTWLVCSRSKLVVATEICVEIAYEGLKFCERRVQGDQVAELRRLISDAVFIDLPAKRLGRLVFIRACVYDMECLPKKKKKKKKKKGIKSDISILETPH